MFEVYLRVAHWESQQFSRLGHYYGFLQHDKEEIQVTRRLTQADAGRLNIEEFGRYDGPEEDLDPWGRYTIGDESGRFWTEVSLLQAAIDTCYEIFPDVTLLIQGSHIVVSPQPVLIGPPGIIDELNDLVRRWNNGEDTSKEWGQIKGSIQ